MSIILDALRRGRGLQAPRPRSTAAQTDAVLQTLGYGRLSSGFPLNRFFALLAAAVAFAIVLWGAVIWITQSSTISLPTVEKEAERPDAARAALVRALALDSQNADAHYNFALLEDEAGNREQALLHYRAFLQYAVAGDPALVAEVRRRVDALMK